MCMCISPAALDPPLHAEINAVQFEANLGCPAVFSNGSTTLVGYNGTVPGPTIVAPRGRHSLVR